MAMTRIVAENEENIRSAIENGISAEAVNSTLEEVINKSDELGKNPEQIKETVETVIGMKENIFQKPDPAYASNFVRQNSERINSAINQGITPTEVANTLVNETNKKGKTHLPFIVKLISKMKKKELKLQKESTKGYQKVKS